MTNTDKKTLDALCEGKSREWFEQKAKYLRGFMTEQRFQTISRTLDMRTGYMTVCMENTFHPQNASAIVRTCEAFGIQDIYTIETICKFNPNLHIVRGTDKWIDIHRNRSANEAIAALRGGGYRIMATTPHQQDCTPETFDVDAGPFALVFGTEHAGISEEIVAAADGFIRIPMCGFVESLNVSASAAIVLYTLSERLRRSKTTDWKIDEGRKAELRFRWMVESLKDPFGILDRENKH